MSEPFLFGGSSLPDELDARVRSELDHGEQLLWVGQPRPRRFARRVIPIVLFGIPWTAFAILFMVIAFVWAGDICMAVFVTPFVAIGLVMLGSPVEEWRRAKRTCYALTDGRAILWEAGFFGFGSVVVRSYKPAALTKIVRRDYADGSGDLVFEEPIGVQDSIPTKCHGFLGIDNVREIEELLRKALLSDSGA